MSHARRIIVTREAPRKLLRKVVLLMLGHVEVTLKHGAQSTRNMDLFDSFRDAGQQPSWWMALLQVSPGPAAQGRGAQGRHSPIYHPIVQARSPASLGNPLRASIFKEQSSTWNFYDLTMNVTLDSVPRFKEMECQLSSLWNGLGAVCEVAILCCGRQGELGTDPSNGEALSKANR